MKFADTMDMTVLSTDITEQCYRAVCAYCAERKDDLSAEGWLMMARDGGVKVFPSLEEGKPLFAGAGLSAIAVELEERLRDAAFEEVNLRVYHSGRKPDETQELFSNEGGIYFRLLW